MIENVAEKLAEKLRGLSFLETVGGIARQQKITVDGKVKTVPAYPGGGNDFILLSPDSSKAGIAYFETISNETDPRYTGNSFRAVLRLIVWVNLSRISPPDTGLMMGQCVKTLEGRHENTPAAHAIRVEPVKEVAKGPELFSRYSYNEAEQQFLMLPFDYFAFDFNVVYALPFHCVDENFIIKPAQC